MPEETVPQLRETLETTQKELKKLQKQNDDLLKTNRTLQAKEAFRDAGLNPKLSDLYTAMNPEGDITEEAVTEFASTWGIAGATMQEGAGEEGGEPEAAGSQTEQVPNTEGLEQMSRAGSRAGDGGQPPVDTKYVTTDEFVQMQRTNPTEAKKALAEGRVKLREDNPLANKAVTGQSPFRARDFSQVASE